MVGKKAISCALALFVLAMMSGCCTYKCQVEYSWNNDPTNPDKVTPFLGLDAYFPPAPLAKYGDSDNSEIHEYIQLP